jgi:hypothetical protein
MRRYTKKFVGWIAPLLVLGSSGVSLGSDHGDTPQLVGAGRHDTRITDLFAFRRSNNLVLIVCTNPAIPPSVATYQFPSDLTLKVYIDNNSAVSFASAADNALYGGTILNPAGIQEDITFTLTFNGAGTPQLATAGLPGGPGSVQLFSGLRDDPFIRGPVIGRNVAAIVMELPLASVIASQSTLLIWATADIDDFATPFEEFVGRSLRSQQAPFLAMNTLPPWQHQAVLGVVPDVMIYNTAAAAGFPNGRRLDDDVVDLVYAVDPTLVQGVVNTDAPFPSANDKPFLPQFPYLAAPHVAGPIPTASAWGLVVLMLVLLTVGKIAFSSRPAPALPS